MPIPELESSGFLPAGRYEATAREVEERFVTPFPNSPTRRGLYEAWMDHRNALEELLPLRSQLIGGSFVSSKLDPGDVDLATVFDALAYEALPRHRKKLASSLLWKAYTRDLWGVHSFPIPYFPSGHPARSAHDEGRGRWEAIWGRTRDDEPRGFLEVLL